MCKKCLIPLILTAALSPAGTGILKKDLGSGSYVPRTYGFETIALIMSNKKMKEIMKIVKSL